MPKLETTRLRAASSGYRETLWCGWPSKTMCSYTSSLSSSTSVGASSVCSCCICWAVQTVPLGLCGELMMSSRVRGVRAAAMRSKSGAKLPDCSGTRTGTAPAMRMAGT